jgi:MFS family permease
MLQRRLHFDAGYLPLLYVAVPCVCLSLAFSFGRLADRWGRAKVLLLGHGLLVLVYWSELLPARGALLLALNVLLLGAFYAASDGLLLALASARLPEPQLASGLGLVVTVNNLGRLLASVAFGLLWSYSGERTALVVFGAVLTGALAALAATLLELDALARPEAAR